MQTALARGEENWNLQQGFLDFSTKVSHFLIVKVITRALC